MDVWIVFTPVLKVLLYIVGLVVVGTKLFDLHFRKYQTIDNMEHCNSLSQKSCLYGLIISVGMIFSIAGNLGGAFLSIFRVLPCSRLKRVRFMKFFLKMRAF